MKKIAILTTIWLGAAAMQAPPAAPMALWRLDCGRLVEPTTKKLPWNKRDMPVGCYLVRHGDRYLLWDAGVSAKAIGNHHPTIKLDRTLLDQLAQLKVKPDDVAFVGISHYHGDHTGQASSFPKATLLMGAGDLEALRRPSPPGGTAPTHLKPWLTDGAPVRELREDLDVFGDGRVMVLMMPGHTPGHTALLVKLPSGPVMLTGDLWATHANVLTDDMPEFNSSFAETTASRERFRRLARKHDATVIIQHEPDDIAKLPPFPQAVS